MPTSCTFELNKPNDAYYSGETISGLLILQTCNDKYLTFARIDFRGEAKVLANERNSKERQCLATEVYIDNSTYVRNEGYLPAGTHSYTFSIPLPLPSPSSLEGKAGYIRYTLSLVLARPLRTNTLFSKRIVVIQNVDLNLNPLYKFPVMTEELNQVGCWPCTNGKIQYNLQIPFAAYVPGQIVRYSLRIENHSMVDLSGYTFKFIQKHKFFTKSIGYGNTSYKHTMWRRNFQQNCLRLTTRLWEGDFQIPPIPPSTINHSIITVEYIIKIIVHVSSFKQDCVLHLPIVIGTIPLRESLMLEIERPFENLDVQILSEHFV